MTIRKFRECDFCNKEIPEKHVRWEIVSFTDNGRTADKGVKPEDVCNDCHKIQEKFIYVSAGEK